MKFATETQRKNQNQDQDQDHDLAAVYASFRSNCRTIRCNVAKS